MALRVRLATKRDAKKLALFLNGVVEGEAQGYCGVKPTFDEERATRHIAISKYPVLVLDKQEIMAFIGFSTLTDIEGVWLHFMGFVKVGLSADVFDRVVGAAAHHAAAAAEKEGIVGLKMEIPYGHERGNDFLSFRRPERLGTDLITGKAAMLRHTYRIDEAIDLCRRCAEGEKIPREEWRDV